MAMESTPRKIVITGGPGTGKTALVEHFESGGHTCYPEIIRTLTEAAKQAAREEEIRSNPLVFVDDPMSFNKKLLEGRKAQYLRAEQDSASLIFFDRGIPDVLAYMDFFRQGYTEDYEQACKDMRYDRVILLPPWKEIYRADGERFESFDEAQEIHTFLLRTYERFGYDPVLVPTAPVPERADFIMDILA